MNREEQLVKSYLIEIGFENPVYEPDGNIPPDFKADKNTAVEVRRLNQNYFGRDGSIKGLEKENFRLNASLERIFRSFDDQYNGKSYAVTLRFQRPIGNIKVVKNILKSKLNTFLYSDQKLPTNIIVSENINIKLSGCSPQHGKFFYLGAFSDRDSSGWLLNTLSENLKHCIEEKTIKIKKYYYKYRRWWLILIYQISSGLDKDQKAFLKKTLEKNLYWDKIVLLNAINGKKIFEI